MFRCPPFEPVQLPADTEPRKQAERCLRDGKVVYSVNDTKVKIFIPLRQGVPLVAAAMNTPGFTADYNYVATDHVPLRELFFDGQVCDDTVAMNYNVTQRYDNHVFKRDVVIPSSVPAIIFKNCTFGGLIEIIGVLPLIVFIDCTTLIPQPNIENCHNFVYVGQGLRQI